MEIIYSLQELEVVVEQVWQKNKGFKVWAFYATMGTGKTTFINALCKYLEVIEMSSSPTFSIINEYESKQNGVIYHLDLYRINDEQGVLDVGIEDVLNSGKYCFIEWPSKAEFLLPDKFCAIEISLLEDEKRKIIF